MVLRACCGWGWQTCFLLQDCTCEGLDDFLPSLAQVLYQLPIFPTSFDYVQLKAGPLRGLLLRGTRNNSCQADMQSGFLNGVPVPWESVLGLEKACTAYSATCSSSDTTLLEAVGDKTTCIAFVNGQSVQRWHPLAHCRARTTKRQSSWYRKSLIFALAPSLLRAAAFRLTGVGDRCGSRVGRTRTGRPFLAGPAVAGLQLARRPSNRTCRLQASKTQELESGNSTL